MVSLQELIHDTDTLYEKCCHCSENNEGIKYRRYRRKCYRHGLFARHISSLF